MNLQYEQQSDLEESSVASETESTLETTSLVKEAEISESADSKNHLIEDSATSQSELDSKSLEENVPENEQFENINLDGIFKNSSNDASAAEEVREDTPKDFDEEEIDNGQPTVPENYEEVE